MWTVEAERFGKLIRRMRMRHGIASVQLAARIQRSQSYVSKIETGALRETPPPDVLEALSRELHVSVGEQLAAMGYAVEVSEHAPELPDDLTPAQRDAVLSYARYLAEHDRTG